MPKQPHSNFGTFGGLVRACQFHFHLFSMLAVARRNSSFPTHPRLSALPRAPEAMAVLTIEINKAVTDFRSLSLRLGA